MRQLGELKARQSVRNERDVRAGQPASAAVNTCLGAPLGRHSGAGAKAGTSTHGASSYLCNLATACSFRMEQIDEPCTAPPPRWCWHHSNAASMAAADCSGGQPVLPSKHLPAADASLDDRTVGLTGGRPGPSPEDLLFPLRESDSHGDPAVSRCSRTQLCPSTGARRAGGLSSCHCFSWNPQPRPKRCQPWTGKPRPLLPR